MSKTKTMGIDELIELAIREDVGEGDHSSLATIPDKARGKAGLLIKESGIIAGIEIAEKVFKKTDPGLRLSVLLRDGQQVKAGDIVFYISGSSRSILTAERLALNFMQRMSGIATHAHELNQKLAGLQTKILDTRKTTPNFRIFEKMAVKTGGGENHRMGLYDMIMIKDNHIDFAGGIRQAIKKTNEYLKQKGKELQIEIEVRNFDELEEVLKTGKISRIMLDNFSPADLKKAVEIINRRYETEASGGITMKTIREYAESGVDYISSGALTHQIKSLDMSLKAIKD
ncbi:MAG: carboxylating nicotinate-nucleotide diphosphorylase [Bacteroidales bacterium]|nr:carboxylating nicotinate-nucleotide diphosphorylase [Bacteroidales bacterium]MCF8344437.1 carboxylating nicotinate-nucleotide diphosphorylase [Bacteroidales bacterium]MCF8351458.1 carboxylating nicotinate-nucleotide diphosphorylase [Bacteroidales bacterium]MCF8375618.1 carboxylating nicotinate-nucleotide diphosphorylase [Bacteroidales bacterium]